MNTSSLLPFMALVAGLFYGTTFAAAAAEDLPSLGIEIPATDDGLPGAGPIRRQEEQPAVRR